MCYHYSLGKTKAQVEKKMNATSFTEVQLPVFHAGAFGSAAVMPVVRADSPSVLTPMTWGLIPHWSTEEKISFNTANAKLEGIVHKASFRKPIQSKRCLIPADGFYEWRHEGGIKYPYFISEPQKELFCFAGIFDEWVNNVTGEVTESFSILTQEANALMARIHNVKKRMPIVVPSKRYTEYLEEKNVNVLLEDMESKWEAPELVAHTISKNFLKKPNTSEKWSPFEYPELALLDVS